MKNLKGSINMGLNSVVCPKCGFQFNNEFTNGTVLCQNCGSLIDLSKASGPQTGMQSAPQTMTPPAPKPMPPMQPMNQPMGQPMGQPMYPQPYQVPVPPFQAAAVIRAELPLAMNYYNNRDYRSAKACLDLLVNSEPDNPGVWFCKCRVLAAETPADIVAAAAEYVNCAERCVRLSPDQNDARGQVTIQFNCFLKRLTEAVEGNSSLVVPYDCTAMSEKMPSPNYRPLAYVDGWYSVLAGCTADFRARVNPNYTDNHLLTIWEQCFFTCSHVVCQQLATDLQESKLFTWYKTNLKSRMVNDTAFNAIVSMLYGYKACFVELFNRVHFRGVKTTAYNNIAFINKWLLNLKKLGPNGRYILLVPDPRQRTALEQEIRNYKVLLSRS